MTVQSVLCNSNNYDYNYNNDMEYVGHIVYNNDNKINSHIENKLITLNRGGLYLINPHMYNIL